jgi:SPP1 family predicted phage head-tail adaptor
VLWLSKDARPVIRGAFDRRVTFQRATVTTNDHGEETPDWGDLEQGWARVRFGSAQEKREAAQESGAQTATFELIPTAALRGVTLRDRILFDDGEWDITEAAPLERNLIRFTATRSV